MPEPPVCSIVNVYSTMFPQRSATVRFVVFRFSVSRAVVPGRGPPLHWPLYLVTSPAATGLVIAWVGLMLHARSAAYLSESRSLCGTLTYAGSPMYLPRSANA